MDSQPIPVREPATLEGLDEYSQPYVEIFIITTKLFFSHSQTAVGVLVFRVFFFFFLGFSPIAVSL